jgi:uncharacterized protein
MPLVAVGIVLAGSLAANRVAAPAHAAIGVVVALALAGIARGAGLTAADLGLARWRRGLGHGVVAAAVLAAGYAVAVVAGLLDDAAGSGRDPWKAALVDIPLGTVLPEELAFRGVLWALLARRWGTTRATVASSVLFGLWHVLPATAGGTANELAGFGTSATVAGTVLLTGVAGLVLCRLRTGSGSLLAPALAHWAANGLGVLAVELA